MKQLIALALLLTTLGCTTQHKENDMDDHAHHQGHHQDGHQHGQISQAGAELVVATDPANPVAGSPVTLKLMIHAADGTMVKDFEVVHEEKVHLVIVRNGLDHFAHIHPTVDANGNLTVTHTFPVGGKYRLFADYSPSGGGNATATGSLSVGGESPAAPALVANTPGEVGADGVRATVTAAPSKVGNRLESPSPFGMKKVVR